MRTVRQRTEELRGASKDACVTTPVLPHLVFNIKYRSLAVSDDMDRLAEVEVVGTAAADGAAWRRLGDLLSASKQDQAAALSLMQKSIVRD